MKYPHFLFREDPTTGLLIIILVCLFVLAFNSYRLGKIRRRTMILCSVAFALGVVALFLFAPK